jgi:hypothetical protein
MKRLYQIIDTKTRKPVDDLYFNDKMAAKAARRELNGGDEASMTTLRYIVSPGPDHYKYARS